MKEKLKDAFGAGLFLGSILWLVADHAVAEPLFQKRRFERALDRCDKRGILDLIDRYPELLNYSARMTGCPVLHYAAKNISIDLLNDIIARKPDMNIRDSAGRTALFYARDASHAQKLIYAGTKINADDASGQTALMHAASRADAVTVSLMLANGANVLHRDAAGRTALDVLLRLPADVTDAIYRPERSVPETANILRRAMEKIRTDEIRTVCKNAAGGLTAEHAAALARTQAGITISDKKTTIRLQP